MLRVIGMPPDWLRARVLHLATAHTRVTRVGMSILLYLLGHTGPDGQAEASHSEIAVATGFSAQQISATLPRLLVDGWIERIERGDTGPTRSRYRWPALA